MESLKTQIKRLRKRGYSYTAISKKLFCSVAVISHHLNPNPKRIKAARLRTKFRLTRLKMDYGGKCLVCGYEKCLEALEFDHLHPKTKKKGGVSSVRRNYKKALREAGKCVLLCCRCHRERHAGIIDLGDYLEPSI